MALKPYVPFGVLGDVKLLEPDTRVSSRYEDGGSTGLVRKEPTIAVQVGMGEPVVVSPIPPGFPGGGDSSVVTGLEYDPLTGLLNLTQDLPGLPLSADLSEISGSLTVAETGAMLLDPEIVTPPTPFQARNLDFWDIFELLPSSLVPGSVEVHVPHFGHGPVMKARRTVVPVLNSSTISSLTEGSSFQSSGTANVFYLVPSHEMDPIPVGAEFEFIRLGAGEFAVNATETVTINGELGGSSGVLNQYGIALLKKVGMNEWVITGDFIPLAPPPPLNIYYWDDIFIDQTPHLPLGYEVGEDEIVDFEGYGHTKALPADIALQWFLDVRIPAEAPLGAIIDLTSPNGTMFLGSRIQPPPQSKSRNLEMRLNDTVIERFEGPDNWGQFFVWGEKTIHPDVPKFGIIAKKPGSPDLSPTTYPKSDTPVGSTVLQLSSSPTQIDNTMALLEAAVPGSIIDIRTNATRRNYHPTSSRTTCIVESVDMDLLQITVRDPLEIAVPYENHIGSYPGETSDPSTVTLLSGGLLSADAGSGATQIHMANTYGIKPGDWLLITTIEEMVASTANPTGNNQWMDNIQSVVDPDIRDLGPFNPGQEWTSNEAVPINQEIHQVAAISGNMVTIIGGLGKNKLMAWDAMALRVDPVDGFHLTGGHFKGNESGTGENAYDHIYIWTRYLINGVITDVDFDMDEAKSTALRRAGQAIRFDTGNGNLADNVRIGRPCKVGAGEGYGLSFRLGERNSVMRNSYIEGCRHSIEFWASSGGCIAEDNWTHNTTSSSIDTHGNWNVGIIIRRNRCTRYPGAGGSDDLAGDFPDAIRIGNNKFLFDYDVEVYDNVIEDFMGTGIRLVPGVQKVYIHDNVIDRAWRGLHLSQGPRHPRIAFYDDIVISNLKMRRITERGVHIMHGNYGATGGPWYVGHGMTLEGFEFGYTDDEDVFYPFGVVDAEIGMPPGTGPDEASVAFIRHMKDVTLKDWIVRGTNSPDVECKAFNFYEVDGMTFDNVVVHGYSRGMQLGKVQNISGTVRFLEGDVGGEGRLLQITDKPTSGTLLFEHDRVTPTFNDSSGSPTVIGNTLALTWSKVA